MTRLLLGRPFAQFSLLKCNQLPKSQLHCKLRYALLYNHWQGQGQGQGHGETWNGDVSPATGFLTAAAAAVLGPIC